MEVLGIRPRVSDSIWCREWLLTATPVNQTGGLAISRVFFSEAKISAAAPSLNKALSATVVGQTTVLDFKASSTVSFSLSWALGLTSALTRFFTATLAICCSVGLPNLCIWGMIVLRH